MKYLVEEKQYIVNEEFHSIAQRIIERDSDKFHPFTIEKLCCVNLLTKEKSPTDRIAKIRRVHMPMALHCPYDWYITIRSADWDGMDEAKKEAVVVDLLMGMVELAREDTRTPTSNEEENK